MILLIWLIAGQAFAGSKCIVPTPPGGMMDIPYVSVSLDETEGKENCDKLCDLAAFGAKKPEELHCKPRGRYSLCFVEYWNNDESIRHTSFKQNGSYTWEDVVTRKDCESRCKGGKISSCKWGREALISPPAEEKFTLEGPKSWRKDKEFAITSKIKAFFRKHQPLIGAARDSVDTYHWAYWYSYSDTAVIPKSVFVNEKLDHLIAFTVDLPKMGPEPKGIEVPDSQEATELHWVLIPKDGDPQFIGKLEKGQAP